MRGTIDLWPIRPAGRYPRLKRGYYAVFFADPDGLKHEFVHLP